MLSNAQNLCVGRKVICVRYIKHTGKLRVLPVLHRPEVVDIGINTI